MRGKELYPGVAYFRLNMPIPGAEKDTLVYICDADCRESLHVGIQLGEDVFFPIDTARAYPEFFTSVTEDEVRRAIAENNREYQMKEDVYLKKSTHMTYREAIQQMVQEAEKVHCDAGALRDIAMDGEKDFLNQVRAHTSKIITLLNTLDNQLPDNRAQMDL
jgi:hypothetical protein